MALLPTTNSTDTSLIAFDTCIDQCSMLPSHYFPLLTNQLAVLFTEFWLCYITLWSILIAIIIMWGIGRVKEYLTMHSFRSTHHTKSWKDLHYSWILRMLVWNCIVGMLLTCPVVFQVFDGCDEWDTEIHTSRSIRCSIFWEGYADRRIYYQG